jgi:ketosteroid isomerase-like protein
VAEHPYVARLRRGFEIRTGGEFGPDEMAFMDDLFDEDIEWHGSGSGQFAEGAKGKENVFMLFGKVAEETDGTFQMTVDDIYADDNHGVVTTRVVAERNGRRYEWKEVDLFRLTPEGRIKEFWGIPEDQEELDRFFND